jgi:hypothetical protein
VVLPEVGFALLNRAISEASRNMTNVTSGPSSSEIPDGLVHISTDDILSTPAEDPLFPGLELSTVLLYRRVEICDPQAHPSAPTVTGGPVGRWVEESLVHFPRSRPHNFPKSANFSSLPRVGDLTLSRAFLESSLYKASLQLLTAPERKDIAVPEFFTDFDDGWYFSSGKGTTANRLNRLTKEGILDFGSFLSPILMFVIGVFLFHGSFLSASFFSRNPIGKSDARRYLMKHCLPGDVRIRHWTFRPKALSLVAWKNGTALEPAEVYGSRISIMGPGERRLPELFGPITDPINEEIQIHVRITLLLAGVTLLVLGPSRAVAALAMASVVGLARAFVWNDHIMTIRNWITIALVSGTVIVYRMRRPPMM